VTAVLVLAAGATPEPVLVTGVILGVLVALGVVVNQPRYTAELSS
jgi:hypothetical protein